LAETTAEVDSIVSRFETTLDPGSIGAGESAVSAGGRSRPHSQFEEPKDDPGGVSLSESQHELVAGDG
jgi:hypothetical protein